MDLDSLLSELKPGLAVDIDETLSWTIYSLASELIAKFGSPENLTVEEIISKYRYTWNVPDWQTLEIQEWTRSRLYDNEFQRNLPIISGADIYLKKVHEIVPVFAYLTARPCSVLDGTIDWLNKSGFPDAPVVTRPDTVDRYMGNKWKAGMLEALFPKLIGLIDDNDGIVKYLGDDYPCPIFLFDHKDVPKSRLDLIACPEWGDVYREVRKRF